MMSNPQDKLAALPQIIAGACKQDGTIALLTNTVFDDAEIEIITAFVRENLERILERDQLPSQLKYNFPDNSRQSQREFAIIYSLAYFLDLPLEVPHTPLERAISAEEHTDTATDITDRS